MAIAVKICGINDASAMQAAVDGGAELVGLIFFPASPRAVSPEQAAELAMLVPADVTPVALTVDADDALLDAICAALPRAMLQLHGQESPERVAEIKARTGRRVIKAIGIAERGDLEKVAAYDRVADRLLFDAKPPPRPDALPGGNAVSFDWTLIKGIKTDKPWMLAGGLGVDNLAQAVADSGARAIDVSSGVEDSPGHKNPDKIRTLLALAATL